MSQLAAVLHHSIWVVQQWRYDLTCVQHWLWLAVFGHLSFVSFTNIGLKREGVKEEVTIKPFIQLVELHQLIYSVPCGACTSWCTSFSAEPRERCFYLRNCTSWCIIIICFTVEQNQLMFLWISIIWGTRSSMGYTSWVHSDVLVYLWRKISWCTRFSVEASATLLVCLWSCINLLIQSFLCRAASPGVLVSLWSNWWKSETRVIGRAGRRERMIMARGAFLARSALTWDQGCRLRPTGRHSNTVVYCQEIMYVTL